MHIYMLSFDHPSLYVLKNVHFAVFIQNTKKMHFFFSFMNCKLVYTTQKPENSMQLCTEIYQFFALYHAMEVLHAAVDLELAYTEPQHRRSRDALCAPPHQPRRIDIIRTLHHSKVLMPPDIFLRH